MNATSYLYPAVRSYNGVVRRALSAVKHAFHPGFARRDVLADHVQRAMAVPRRGGVAHDALQIHALSARIQVEWMARPVHPWDLDLSTEEQSELFAEQCLQDVDQAVARLFEQLNAVDELDVCVLHPESSARILGGVVRRTDFLAAKRLSRQMRLKMAGLAYEIGHGGLQREC